MKNPVLYQISISEFVTNYNGHEYSLGVFGKILGKAFFKIVFRVTYSF